MMFSNLSQFLVNLKPGDHLCCLYETEEERYTVLVPFMRQGLEQGEKVIYIGADADGMVRRALCRGLFDPGPFLARGQLLFLELEAVSPNQDVLAPGQMLELLGKETEKALAEGYTALRVTGEMGWLVGGISNAELLIEYEALLGEFFQESYCVALCQYQRQQCSSDFLLEVLRTHPLAVVGAEIYDNFYYMPPDELLERDRAGTVLRHWLHNLVIYKYMQEALYESEVRYHSLFEDVPVGLYRTTPDGRILDANMTLVQMLRYPDRQTLLRASAASIYASPAERKRWQDLMEKNGLVRNFETQFRCYDGVLIWVVDSAQAVWGENKEILYYKGSLQDITERKRMEQYMLRTERLAAMGHMAAVLAHEIKNPLHAAQSNVELLLDYPLDPEERDMYLRLCAQELEHLRDITHRVLSFASSGKLTYQMAAVDRLLEQTLALIVEPSRRARVHIETHIPAGLPPVRVAFDMMVQVFLNLVINAIEAMSGGGRLTIIATPEPGQVSVAFENTGPVIPEEHLNTIFDPFFTTKSEGTGLGLPISHNIVQQHGGTLTARNLSDNQGVVFTVTLPIA